MNILGMGAMEVIAIMIVALIIFGPDRLPEMGAQAGKALRDVRNMTREMTGEFEESISDVRGAMEEMKSTVAEVQRDTRDLATSVTEITDSAAAELRASAHAVNAETASLAEVARPDLSARPSNTATARRPSPATSVVTDASQTQLTRPVKPSASPEAKKVGSSLPTRKDPLADIGGYDES